MKHFLKKILKPTGYTLTSLKVLNDPQKQKPITRDDFFDIYFSKIDPKNFFFVQIGANDGKTNDPLHSFVTKYGLSGLVVEPQPDAFKLLKDNYRAQKNVECVQAAIGSHSGTVPFYVVKESEKNKDNWFRMTRIASFNKESIKLGLKKKIKPNDDPEDYIEEVPIKAISFSELVTSYKVKKIDFLQIDCEGYDFELLKTIDIEHLCPEIINFESHFFTEAERAIVEARLTKLGYKFFRYGSDTCAFKVS